MSSELELEGVQNSVSTNQCLQATSGRDVGGMATVTGAD